MQEREPGCTGAPSTHHGARAALQTLLCSEGASGKGNQPPRLSSPVDRCRVPDFIFAEGDVFLFFSVFNKHQAARLWEGALGLGVG